MKLATLTLMLSLMLTGAALADGAAIRVEQVEAPIGGGTTDPIYRADPVHPDFSGVTFHDQIGGPNPAFSGHATGVARFFAGTVSMTPGVRDVDSYETNDWLGTVLYNAGNGLQRPVVGTGVLANQLCGGDIDAGGGRRCAGRLRLAHRHDRLHPGGRGNQREQPAAVEHL